MERKVSFADVVHVVHWWWLRVIVALICLVGLSFQLGLLISSNPSALSRSVLALLALVCAGAALLCALEEFPVSSNFEEPLRDDAQASITLGLLRSVYPWRRIVAIVAWLAIQLIVVFVSWPLLFPALEGEPGWRRVWFHLSLWPIAASWPLAVLGLRWGFCGPFGDNDSEGEFDSGPPEPEVSFGVQLVGTIAFAVSAWGLIALLLFHGFLPRPLTPTLVGLLPSFNSVFPWLIVALIGAITVLAIGASLLAANRNQWRLTPQFLDECIRVLSVNAKWCFMLAATVWVTAHVPMFLGGNWSMLVYLGVALAVTLILHSCRPTMENLPGRRDPRSWLVLLIAQPAIPLALVGAVGMGIAGIPENGYLSVNSASTKGSSMFATLMFTMVIFGVLGLLARDTAQALRRPELRRFIYTRETLGRAYTWLSRLAIATSLFAFVGILIWTEQVGDRSFPSLTATYEVLDASFQAALFALMFILVGLMFAIIAWAILRALSWGLEGALPD